MHIYDASSDLHKFPSSYALPDQSDANFETRIKYLKDTFPISHLNQITKTITTLESRLISTDLRISNATQDMSIDQARSRLLQKLKLRIPRKRLLQWL